MSGPGGLFAIQAGERQIEIQMGSVVDQVASHLTRRLPLTCPDGVDPDSSGTVTGTDGSCPGSGSSKDNGVVGLCPWSSVGFNFEPIQ